MRMEARSYNNVCGQAATIREPAGAIITNCQYLSYTVFSVDESVM